MLDETESRTVNKDKEGEFHCDGLAFERGKHHILGDSLV